MILDATAGNRMLWINKESDNIIYIDRQTELAVKPTLFCDNRQTPFKDKTFDTIIFDPPHDIRGRDGFFSHPSGESYNKFYKKSREIPTYYGAELFKTKIELLRYIYEAQIEFQRTLKDDGLLWLKWCDMQIQLYRIISMFDNWKLLMQIKADQPTHIYKQNKTYWLCMEKLKSDKIQQTL